MISALLISVIVFAQAERGHVYLKNGTILKGKYRWIDDSRKLQVETAGNIWVFSDREVEKVTGRRGVNVYEAPAFPYDSKFFSRIELGVLAGNSQNSQDAPLSVTGSLNWRIGSVFSIGPGFGAEFLKETYLPAFLNMELKWRKSLSSPYIFVKGGYQVPLEESREIYYDVRPMAYDVRPWSSSSIWPGPWPGYNFGKLEPLGGPLLNAGMGYTHIYSSGFGMSVAFGYQFHRLQYTGEKDYRLDIDYNRLTVKLGFIFN
jgi:hypothetical protein